MTANHLIHKPETGPGRRLSLLALSLLFICNGLLLISPRFCHSAGPGHILHLNSYHAGYKWSDDVVKGVRDALREFDGKLTYHIEYMDTKRFHSDEYYRKLFSVYKNKYSDMHLDLIICSDNNALEFLKKYRAALFPEAPVVFCGINNFTASMIQGMNNITGVNEAYDIKRNIELMLTLHPETKRVIFVNDTTTTGKNVHEQITSLLKTWKPDIEFIFFEKIEMPALQKELAQLGNGDLVFFTIFFKDSAGRTFEFYESVSMICSSSAVPVYSMEDFNLGYGIVGGLLASGYFQGNEAGKAALSILKGKPAGAIPVLMESPNRFMFDYRQMKKFGITEKNLPEGSILINRPDSFYQTHKTLVWSVSSAILLLLVLVIFLFINIQVRKSAEKQLRESEEKYRSMMDAMEDYVYICSEDYRIEYMNRALIERTGFDGTGEPCHKVLHNHDSICPWCTGSDLKVRKTLDWEVKSPRDNCWFSVINTPIRHENGSISMLAILRDITEKKHADENLKKLRNLMANIIDSMPTALVGVNGEEKITQWNREAEKITGTPRQKAYGRIFYEAFPALDEKKDEVKLAIKSRTLRKDSRLTATVDDRKRFFSITIYPLVYKRAEGAVILVDDITEKMQLEEMMIQTEKMMSIGGIAGGMAHEIRNPLGGILQNIQVITNRIFGEIKKNETVAQECGTHIETIRSYIRKRGIEGMFSSINESGKRASKIIEDMLSFSRSSDSTYIPHDMRTLLDNTIAIAEQDYNLKKKYDFRNIEIVRDYASDLVDVHCMGGKIQQVFLNILKNGAEAMNEAGTQNPTFRISAALDKDKVRIEIRDNGPGMEEKIRSRIFEPFFTTKKQDTGTGLGLSVSYFIITEDHGGTITVESSPGKGTNFIIILPQTREDMARSDTPEAVADKK